MNKLLSEMETGDSLNNLTLQNLIDNAIASPSKSISVYGQNETHFITITIKSDDKINS